ncbi:hypothetical protein NDA12_005303 [Ustilago hordei]|nr:hypothetical protein NDA12_005303 [Ustilago hordei]
MSQRPQRAAAVQAIKANAAALAPRRRSDSQTSSRTITSPPRQGRRSSSSRGKKLSIDGRHDAEVEPSGSAQD